MAEVCEDDVGEESGQVVLCFCTGSRRGGERRWMRTSGWPAQEDVLGLDVAMDDLPPGMDGLVLLEVLAPLQTVVQESESL